MSIKAGSGVAGYKYYLSFLAGICRGSIDALLAVKVGEKTAWEGSVGDSTNLTISKPGLFGGEEKEGGIDGTLRTFFGGVFQTIPTSIQNSLNGMGITTVPDDFGEGGGEVIEPPGTGLVPNLLGVTTFFWKGLIGVNNPYLKTWKFKVRRTNAGWAGNSVWYPERAAIPMSSQGDGTMDIVGMNPAHILYQCMTDPVWGRGLDTSLISDLRMRQAADVFWREGFGLCIRYTRQDRQLREFMTAVVEHISGALFLDRRSGVFTLTPFRGGYNPDLLPHFDADSGLLKVEDDQSGSADLAANEVVIQWHDPIEDKDRKTKVQNLASIQSQGAIISITQELPGIPTAALAARVATRELAAQAAGLKRFKLTLDRSGRKLAVGDLFRFSDPSRNLDNIVCRVGQSTIPGPREEGKIVVECVQDIFSLPTTSYLGYQPSLMTFPNNTPVAANRFRVEEASYRDLLRTLSPANFAALLPATGFLTTTASRPNQLSATYELWTKLGSDPYVKRAVVPWSPTGRLAANATALQTTFTLEAGSEWDSVVVGGAALMGSEIVQVTAFNATTGVATVVRGCLDTIPQTHTAGEFLFFYDDTLGSDNIEYNYLETPSAKLLTMTSEGVLDIGSGATNSVQIQKRKDRPYPPGNVKVSGVGGAVSIYLIDPLGEPPGDKVITWTHRNKVTQADAFIGHTAGSVSPPAGVTYSLKFYTDPGNVLKRTVTGLTGTTYTYTAVNQVADGIGHRCRVELWSVEGGLESLRKYNFVLPLLSSGYGYGYGNNYGQVP